MNPVPPSVIALIVGDEKRALVFDKAFRELLDDKTRPTLKNSLEIERFRSVAEFLRAQRDRKNLRGTVVDLGLIGEANDSEKRALALLEELQIPILKVAEKMVGGDAVDRKILTGKWAQLMDQVEAFAPRGLRVHTRKICYIKVRYALSDERLMIESRAITYDLSPGGCFIISMEDWSGIEDVSIYLGDHPTPVPCRIAWRLPWGTSAWKMPGIGVEFRHVDENLKNYLANFLKEA